ncbi:hypothetical protein EB796_005737 [Bugula neritina]|uniref:Uncharacterized protein n=1 Tax=Bugula neritina TaxID=10212 RepID=A0A7J7KBF0_BUGNE|nr:hypothetical protein EB796_005737 [Bugula neritina]
MACHSPTLMSYYTNYCHVFSYTLHYLLLGRNSRYKFSVCGLIQLGNSNTSLPSLSSLNIELNMLKHRRIATPTKDTGVNLANSRAPDSPTKRCSSVPPKLDKTMVLENPEPR